MIRDAQELRAKESDRIHVLAGQLSRLGARVEELPDGLRIEGVQRLRGAPVESHDDHRIAMAMVVAALAAEGPTTLSGAGAVRISYPEFFEHIRALAPGAIPGIPEPSPEAPRPAGG